VEPAAEAEQEDVVEQEDKGAVMKVMTKDSGEWCRLYAPLEHTR
jgi:hypothetical protein